MHSRIGGALAADVEQAAVAALEVRVPCFRLYPTCACVWVGVRV